MRTGEGNSKAKKWKMVDPKGKEYLIYGTLKVFCKEKNLILSALMKYKGKPYEPNKLYIQKYTNKKLNTRGWILYEL